MKVVVFTLWASMRGEEPSPWMIAAEDEFSWEGDEKRCDKVFADARAEADRNGWDVREIQLEVDLQSIGQRFEPGKTEATITDLQTEA